jgi:hypothetical protein
MTLAEYKNFSAGTPAIATMIYKHFDTDNTDCLQVNDVYDQFNLMDSDRKYLEIRQTSSLSVISSTSVILIFSCSRLVISKHIYSFNHNTFYDYNKRYSISVVNRMILYLDKEINLDYWLKLVGTVRCSFWTEKYTATSQ